MAKEEQKIASQADDWLLQGQNDDENDEVEYKVNE